MLATSAPTTVGRDRWSDSICERSVLVIEEAAWSEVYEPETRSPIGSGETYGGAIRDAARRLRARFEPTASCTLPGAVAGP